MIIGFFFVRVIPLPKTDPICGLDTRIQDRSTEPDVSAISLASASEHDNSQTPLLSHTDSEEQPFSHQHEGHLTNDHFSQNRHSLEQSPARTGFSDGHALRSSRSPHGRSHMGEDAAKRMGYLPNIHGKALWRSGDFWLLCSILSLRGFLFSNSFHCANSVIDQFGISERNGVNVFVSFYIVIITLHFNPSTRRYQQCRINVPGAVCQG